MDLLFAIIDSWTFSYLIEMDERSHSTRRSTLKSVDTTSMTFHRALLEANYDRESYGVKAVEAIELNDIKELKTLFQQNPDLKVRTKLADGREKREK